MLGSLVGAMTLSSLILMALEPGPSMGTLTVPALTAVDRSNDPMGLIYQTRIPADDVGWNRIHISFSRTAHGSAELLTLRDRRRGLDKVANHFIIGNGNGSGDGELEITRRWRRQVAAETVAADGPRPMGRTVSICLVGDPGQQRPSERQLRTLRELVRSLQVELAIPREQVETAEVAARFPELDLHDQLVRVAP